MAKIEDEISCNAKDIHGIEYGWCAEEHKAVHHEGDKHFCVFHAPRGKKKVSVNLFNAQVIGKIQRAKEAGVECELSGTVFEGDFELPNDFSSKDSPLPDLDFSWAQFQSANFKSANFKNVHFSKAVFQNANFTSANFEKVDFCFAHFESADFSIAEFNKVADFMSSEFKDVDFRRAKFQTAEFSGAVFEKASFCEVSFNIAYFRGAVFKRVDFIKAQFQNADFSLVKFEESNFSLAKFQTADFTECEFESVNFRDARFLSADFTVAEFQSADFSLAKFEERVDFFEASFKSAHFNSARFARVVFIGAKFEESADFSAARFENAEFLGAKFSGSVDFSDAKFESASFEETEFTEKVSFQKAQIMEELAFIRCDFEKIFVDLRDMVIKGDVLFQRTKLHMAAFANTDIRSCKFFNCNFDEKGERYILYDEKLLNKKEKYYYEEFDYAEDRIKAVESLYRANKQRSGESHNQFDYSKWHISEKEMQRRRFKETPMGKILGLYNLFSGYGEAPARAFWWFIGFVVAAVIAISSSGINDKKDKTYKAEAELVRFEHKLGHSYYLKFVQIPTTTLYALETLTYMKTPEFTPANNKTRTARLLGRLATTLQLTLFAMALRNRFRR